MDDSIRVALYARVSSERQADEMTILSQVAAIRERITKDGYAIDDELCFLDDGFSGTTMLRPGLERLRDLAQSGSVDRLYVLAPDRLARIYAYQFVLIEELRKCNVDVVFLNNIANDATPEGNLLLQVQGVIAEYERAKILERMRRGRRFAAKQGKVSALSHAPYGYRYVTKHDGDGEARYDVLPTESGHVKAMFTWVGVEGLSLSGVSRRLFEQGIPTPKGKPRWHDSTIRGILLNSAYQGVAKFGKVRILPRQTPARRMRGVPMTSRADKIGVPMPIEEQENIPVPALISTELFHAAAERLGENRKRTRERIVGAEYLLSGLLVCAACGGAYCGRRHRGKGDSVYVYYRCVGGDIYRRGLEDRCTNASMNGRVEEVIWSNLCALLRNPDRMRSEFEARLRNPAHKNGELTSLTRAIAEHKRRIARLIDSYETGLIDKAEFEPRIRAAKERLTRDEAKLAECQRASQDAEELRTVMDQFEVFAEHVQENLAQADFETKRKLMQLLIKHIDVTAEDIRIVYKVSARPFVSAPNNGGFLQHSLKFLAIG